MINKQFNVLEDALDLPRMSETEIGEPPSEEDVKEALEKAKDLEKEVDKIDGYDLHDEEMDSLAEMAVQSHKDLQELGMAVDIRFAGEIFSSSSQMLKIAVDAKNLKVEKKLKLLRLQLEKLRLDKIHSDKENTIDGSAQRMDRNQLVKMLKDMGDSNK